MIFMKCHWHSVYSRRRQSASSMATKHQSVDCRKNETLAKATKRQSIEYREREAQAMAAKRQSADYREREAQAMATKCQSADYREREAQAKATKRQSAEYREREAQAMATKRQSAEYRERERLRLRLPSVSPLTTEREAHDKATKRQSTDYREREAQQKATKRQSSEYREKEAQAKKQCRIKQRSTPSNVLQASQAFIAATKEGPDYTCVCCNHLMYRKTVIEFKVTKYNKAPDDFTVPDSGIKQWMCKTCDNPLKRGKLPAQAKANNLDLEDIPSELSDLNSLEVRFISLRIPFMKMVALPCGKQRAIHGPAVNVPTDLTPVCTLLPRLPSQMQMVPVKLKRKLCYKGHYMFQYVRPVKVLAALQWLKLNNPLYKDIEINDDWTSIAGQDDADLWEAVSAEQCPPPSSPPSSTTSQAVTAEQCPPPSATSQMLTEQLQLNGK